MHGCRVYLLRAVPFSDSIGEPLFPFPFVAQTMRHVPYSINNTIAITMLVSVDMEKRAQCPYLRVQSMAARVPSEVEPFYRALSFGQQQRLSKMASFVDDTAIVFDGGLHQFFTRQEVAECDDGRVVDRLRARVIELAEEFGAWHTEVLGPGAVVVVHPELVTELDVFTEMTGSDVK